MISVRPNNSSTIDDDQYSETFNSEFNYEQHLHAEFELEHQIVKKRSKRFFGLLIKGINTIAGLVTAGTQAAKPVHKYPHEGDNENKTGDIAQTMQQTSQITYMLNHNSVDINRNFNAIQMNSQDIKLNRDEVQQNDKDIVHNLEEIVANNIDINRNYEAIREFEHSVNRNFELSMIHFKDIEKKVDSVLTDIQDSKVEILDRIEIVKAEILQSIQNSLTEPIFSHLSTFFDYFTRQAKAIGALALDERIARLEKADGIVHFLESSKTPQPGTLYTLLSDIINERFAIPANKDDKMAIAILHLLCYGMNVYVFIIYFLVQQYALLTEIYLHKNDIEKHNKYFLSSLETFKDFSNTLIESNGFLDKVNKVLDTVKNLDFIQKERKDVIEFVDKSLANFYSIRQVLDQLSKHFVFEVPSKSDIKLDFASSKSKTPLENWKNGATVNYAIQFVGNDTQMSSLISDWSSDYLVDEFANPIVQIPTDPQGRTRVIFRKFTNYKSEIVAVIRDSSRSDFRDINRDLYNAATQSNEKAALKDIAILIENGANVNALFEQNKAAIHAAAENNNWNVAYALIQNGANIDAKDHNGHSPIYIATEVGHETFVRNLVQHGANVNVRTNKAHLELTPLHTAAYKGQKGIVQILLQLNQTDLNAKSSNGFTPLHFAASFNQTDIVSLLVADKRTELNVKSEQQLTPLHLASINNCDQVVEVMLGAKGVDLNAQTANNATPLHLASVYGSEKVVASLLKKDADIYAKSTNGSNVVHYAAVMGDQAILSSVTSEANVNAQNDFEITPLYVAYQYNNTKAAAKLVAKHCANANIRLSGHKTLLHLAAINGDISAVHNLLDQKHSVATKDAWGKDPLYCAVQNGRVEIARILLQNNAKPDSKDFDNKPILHLVAELDEIDALNMVKMLVQNRANINIADKFNNTLLHVAIKTGQLSIIKFLLEKAADVNAKNINNDTPLRLAKIVQPKQSDIASFLTQNGVEDSGDKVDFLDACAKGNLNLIKYLHEVCAVDVRVKDGDNQNGLFKAIEGQVNLDVVKYLVNIGVGIHGINLERFTLVHWAAAKNRFDIVKYLIEQMADFKSANKYNSTPLHYAAEFNNLKMVKYFLHLGLNVNDKGYDNRTPLLSTILNHGKLKVVEYLIKSGAQTNTTDKYGKTASTYATEQNKTDIRQYLEHLPTDNIKLQTQIDINSLFFAAAQNNIKLVEQYLNKNISVNVQDEDDGQTPLYRAIDYSGDLNMIKFLHSKGADITQFDATKLDNFVYLSIIKHKFAVAKYLMESGADCQTAGISGNTPLHGAIEIDNIDMLKYLLDKDAYNNHKNSANKTPFDLLIEGRKDRLIKYLVFEYKDKQAQTVLHEAAFQGDAVNVQFLLERGAHVNAADELKNTPLHLAAQSGQLETVKLLLKQVCIDTLAANSNGKTALKVAQYSHKDDVAAFLSEAAKSSATRPSFLLGNIFNNFVGTLKAFTESLTQFQMPTFFRDSIPPSSNEIPNKLTAPSESIDLASTLFLFDVLARKYTGQQYYNAKGRSVSASEARTYSLTLVQKYEKLLLSQLASTNQQNSNVSQVVLECDMFSLYRTIERYMLSGQYSRIDSLLYSHAHTALLNLSNTTTTIPHRQLIQMVDRLLIETHNTQRDTDQIITTDSHSIISEIAAKATQPKLIHTINTKQQCLF